MSITHGGFPFPHIHGALVPAAADVPAQVHRVAGIKGESHLVDTTKGRMWSCTYTLQGYSSYAELMAAINQIDSREKQLSGTVTVTGNAADTIDRMTFWKFERPANGLFRNGVDGSWGMRGRLIWIQQRF